MSVHVLLNLLKHVVKRRQNAWQVSHFITFSQLVKKDTKVGENG